MSPVSLLLSLVLSFLPSVFSQTKNFSSLSASNSPWSPSQGRLLLSNNFLFSAGFLPLPADPSLYTFSIWYHNLSLSTPLWSANPTSPVNRSAALSLSSSGSLSLLPAPSRPNIWPGTSTNGTKLVLTDFGELVSGDWSSFHHLTDTILPNQNISRATISSKNNKYKFVNSTALLYNGSDVYWSIENSLQMLQDDGTVNQANGASLVSSDFGSNQTRRLTLDDDGNLRIFSFDPKSSTWVVVWRAMGEICKVYGICGPNSICMSSDDQSTQPSCVCPPGFRNSSGKCERKIKISNPENTKFLKLDYVNFSGGSNQTILSAQNISLCQSWCLLNPNCLGYGFKYDGLGYCVLQIDRLLNGYWSPGTEMAMFLRVDRSEIDTSNFTGMTNLMETTCPIRISLPLPPKKSDSTTRNTVIVCTLFAAELIGGFLFFWAFLKKYIKYRDMARTLGLEFLPAGGPKRFGYAELKAATNNFSSIIGKGGFGDVYRGELSDHRIVAVKCLKNVAGGDSEFWAEVTIIARMHHLNLVRLWGFCAEKGQRILVYEYVPNGSLDKFLFSSVQQVESANSEGETNDNPEPGYNKLVLDWSIRYRIALGVARAIAYLHEECLEWVLHCDIKPENILLGDDFCPKISDFGLAKLRKKEDMVSMSRIRGTRGYMAPEWVKSETITSKADVYSFGMVLLEIVTGVRNFEIQGSRVESDDWYFPRWAYEKAFKEMKVEDILDRRIKHSYDSRTHFEIVERMVKTAMWCLQDRADMRPSMGKVAKMLEGTVEITEPKKPTIFYLGED